MPIKLCSAMVLASSNVAFFPFTTQVVSTTAISLTPAAKRLVTTEGSSCTASGKDNASNQTPLNM